MSGICFRTRLLGIMFAVTVALTATVELGWSSGLEPDRLDRPAVLPTPAQSPDVSGTWDVTWDMGIRTDGDRVLEVQRRGPATLVLEQRGDSLFGTWTVPIGNEIAYPIEGTVRGDTLTLAASDATVPDGGREIPVTIRWTGTVEGDGIRGTLYLIFPRGGAPPRQWQAVRRRD